MDSLALRGAVAAALALLATAPAIAADCTSERGGAPLAAQRAEAFLKTLTPDQRKAAVHPYERASAIRWSNLPVVPAPRIGLRMGDFGPAQTAAADALLRATLSSCGLELLAGVRAADSVLKPLDRRKVGWDPANYFIAFIGEPSATRPWILQVGGHHIAYNISLNGPRVGATPLFDGVEPLEFKVGDRAYAPLAEQARLMRAVATSVADLPGARLEGEFRDITRGAVQGGDANFPISYPTGATGRGIAFANLDATRKAAVREAMRAWVHLPNGAISVPLITQYLSREALEQTYVGVSGSPDLAKPGSYVRIDGPRVWIEFIVQPAVADPSKIHYHTIWRDKLADYGGAFGK